jgi:nitrogen regulatory protein PII
VLKMVMVVYNEATDDEVMDVLGNCAMKNYTKVSGVFGRGTASGTHLGDDTWPGRNNILYCVCNEKQANQLLSCVRSLRAAYGHEGIKAFVMPVEEMT